MKRKERSGTNQARTTPGGAADKGEEEEGFEAAELRGTFGGYPVRMANSEDRRCA